MSAIGLIADGICPSDAVELSDRRCDLRWQSHARTGADYDGTINQIGDRDEEWNIELAIPLRALGMSKPARGTRLSVSLRRCEIAFNGPRACGRWGSEQQPSELVFD